MLNIKEIGLCGGVWLAGACVFSFVAKGAEWIVKEKDESLGEPEGNNYSAGRR